MEAILDNLWTFILTVAAAFLAGSLATRLGMWAWLATLLNWRKSDG